MILSRTSLGNLNIIGQSSAGLPSNQADRVGDLGPRGLRWVKILKELQETQKRPSREELPSAASDRCWLRTRAVMSFSFVVELTTQTCKRVGGEVQRGVTAVDRANNNKRRK